MIYLYSFIYVGLLCLIGQLILDNTKLTNGHITSIFVVIGAILSFLGIHDILKNIFGVVVSLPITSFGNLLYQASIEGYYNNGFIGIFSNMLTDVSAGITYTFIISFIITIIFKPKD